MRVAYSGTTGAFAHIAAKRMFPEAEYVAFSSFKEAYDAVQSGEYDCAVLPIENSYAGEVGEVMDLIFRAIFASIRCLTCQSSTICLRWTEQA